jgi:drug/metabolite transporter (DMT)-like permease
MIMVLLTPVFFSSKLRWYHYSGAALAAIGSVVLVSGNGLELKVENLKGYLLAFGAALSWPLYSLVKKKMGEVSIWSVGGFCLGAGLLCLLTHAWIEPRVVLQWHDARWIIFMGLGPFGLAFYAWDMAMNRGDARLIGALSYLTPVLSTLGLVFFAGQNFSSASLIAMFLIIGGASAGLLDFLPSREVVK